MLYSGFEIVAGLLYVPLSSGGKDFIAFLRKGQPQHVRWAGKPYKEGVGTQATLEPRKSFKIWSEIVAGQCREWTEEQLETVGVLALVYGKVHGILLSFYMIPTVLSSLLKSGGRKKVPCKPLNLRTCCCLTLAMRVSTDTQPNDFTHNQGHTVRTPLNHIIKCVSPILSPEIRPDFW